MISNIFYIVFYIVLYIVFRYNIIRYTKFFSIFFLINGKTGIVDRPPKIDIPKEYPTTCSIDKLFNPIPFAPLYIIKKQLISSVIDTNNGKNIDIRLFEYGFLNTNFLTVVNNKLDNIPDNTGDNTHEITIPETPPTYGKLSTYLYQITQSGPDIAIVIPIIPPTQECVVETGNSYRPS